MSVTVVVSAAELGTGELTLQGDPFRHLFRARRLHREETLRVVDGAGRARWGRVATIDRRSARVLLGAEAPTNEPGLPLHLLTACPRLERAAWMVEKATEVGVASVRFLSCDRSPRPLGRGQLERLRRVAVSAVEQCHRSRVPELTGEHPLGELPALLAGVATAWVLDPAGGETLTPAPGPWAVVVGPEGGWAPAELEALYACGLVPARLGDRILRIETAAVVTAAMVLLRQGAG